jgi:NAD(P)-dependent dehydrogenase (short-subunit alcohol dehydrogenase family)
MGMLHDKVAIVTGASGGIGRATAALFVREGAAVMMVDRDEPQLRSAAEEIGGEVAITAADVSDLAQTRMYVARALERFGRIDVLFANAGIEGRVAPITEYPLEEFDRVLAVNVRGPFLGLCAYVASKHATIGLVKTAACELASMGIRVNTVNPGPIENRMMRSIEDQAAPGHGDDVKKGFLGMVPMARYGTNEEIASLVLFLASDRSSYCTGAVFLADGGLVAQ